MSKKKGLGRDVNKSLTIIDSLLQSLKTFIDMPLKKGLSSNKVVDNGLNKIINESLIEAFSLINKVEDLKGAIKSIKLQQGNSRFANRVISRFLTSPYGLGGTDFCICTNCGYREEHERGIPCRAKMCPKCNSPMYGML